MLKNLEKNGLSLDKFINLCNKLHTLEENELSLDKFVNLYTQDIKFPVFEEYLQF